VLHSTTAGYIAPWWTANLGELVLGCTQTFAQLCSVHEWLVCLLKKTALSHSSTLGSHIEDVTYVLVNSYNASNIPFVRLGHNLSTLLFLQHTSIEGSRMHADILNPIK